MHLHRYSLSFLHSNLATLRQTHSLVTLLVEGVVILLQTSWSCTKTCFGTAQRQVIELLNYATCIVQTLIVRAKAAQQLEAKSAGQMNLSSSPHRHSIPPQQLGKARRAMETQQEGILKCQQKLALLMSVTGKG